MSQCYDRDGNPTYEHVHIYNGTHGLRWKNRGDGHPLVEIYVEDDGSFFHRMSFSAYWLPHLIRLLQLARSELEYNPDDEHDIRLKEGIDLGI
jgi:hypothetical protein